MKHVIITLTLFATSLFAFSQTTTTALFLCSTGDCSGGSTIISSAPSNGSTVSYIVWFINSTNAPTSATATPLPSATSGTANVGVTTITGSGPSYTISIPFTISNNQGKPTISNVDFSLNVYTAASFPGSALTTSFSVATSTPLPVEFVDVSVSKSMTGIHINWSTASELNNDFFSVEKSLDGENWFSVGEVLGAGNSEEILDYTFVDQNVSNSKKAFYRIKQVDFDGNFDFSKVVLIDDASESNTVSIYPNPAKSNDIITVRSSSEIENISVKNISGQIVNSSFNRSTNELDISNLGSGMYYITVNSQSYKFIK